jgi:excisionase family DNA binding protein
MIEVRLGHSPQEASKLLGISKRMVDEMLAQRLLTSTRFGRRHVIPRTEIERVLREGVPVLFSRIGNA